MSVTETHVEQHVIANDGSYVLSHDSLEQKRLVEQSYAIWKLMGDRHITAPIIENATLLIDVGCGMGTVTKSLATDHPNANVVGVDLVNLLDLSCLPPNMSFVQGDILSLAGQNPHLPYGKADLVFSRLLVAGFKDGKWPSYIETAARLVKPGGYLNFVDLSVHGYGCTDPRDPIGTKRPEHVEILELLVKAAASHGFDFECGMRLEQRMKDAGLIDVEVEEFPMPCGRWLDKDYPPARGFDYNGQGSGLANAFTKLFRSQMSEEEAMRRTNEVRELFDSGVGIFMVLHAARGRTPPLSS